MGAASRAALLVSAVVGVGHAFVPTGRAASPAARAIGGDVVSVVADAPVRAQPQAGQGLSAVSGVAAALLAAVAWRAAPARGTRRAAKTVICEVKHSSPAFAGATLPKLVEASAEEEDLTACRSLKSCHKLYFHRDRPYKDRAKRNIRNRAYNIFHKNEYKRQFRRALKKVKELQYGEETYSSKDEVMTILTPFMDNACLTIDEVCIQGILHRNTAARRKDRLCRAVLRGLVAMGLAETPEDPFVPAYEVIGYAMPKSYKTREPRPWQLPGWKSPWMLKKEYDMWKKQREAKKAAA